MYEQPSAHSQPQRQRLRSSAMFFVGLFSIIYVTAGVFGILG